MQSLPLVSVIVVTWNSKKYLPAWVIYTQRGHKLRFFKGGKPQFVTVGIILMHTFHDFEVILLDNGSEDGALNELHSSVLDF